MKCRLAFGVMNDAYQVTSVIEFQVMRLARLVHVEECLLANFQMAYSGITRNAKLHCDCPQSYCCLRYQGLHVHVLVPKQSHWTSAYARFVLYETRATLRSLCAC